MKLKFKSKALNRTAWIIGILLFWQLAPLTVATVTTTTSRDPGSPRLSEYEQGRLKSLLNPSERDMSSANAFIETLRSAHLAAMPIWQEATRRLLANEPQESVFADLDSKLPQAPDNVAKRYASHANWLKTDFWRDNREKMLVTALGYGNTDENVIAELQAKLSTKTEVSPESERIYFLTMAFLNEHRYQDALNTVIDYNRTRSYENISIEKLVIDLRALRDSPQDFETNIEITRGELSYVPHWGGHEAFLEFCWQLWPKADTADKKHKLLESITEGYEAGADRDIASQVCDAAARITGEANGVHVTNQGYFLSEVAQSEAESGSKMLARELYKELCARFPSDLNWGVYKYNYGLLLEQTGYPARAEVVLKELINSNVNDEDPGGSLMQTNQNYRHEAAILISKIRLELGDAQGARDWRYLSIVKYKFVSWCGTCSWAEASRDSSDLFIASVASGPIQVVRYFILYPWNLSFALLIAPVPLVIVVRRTRRRRKKAKMDSSGSMNETSSND